MIESTSRVCDPIRPSPRIETRRAQMFPRLTPAEMARIRPLGQVRTYAAGEAMHSFGDSGQGLILVLSGRAETTERGANGCRRLIEASEPGSFHGELAQLSGRPWLVDVHATNAVEALTLTPQAVRALMISDADLGERIMRAMILRRMLLIEARVGGPMIIGFSASAEVLRL